MGRTSTVANANVSLFGNLDDGAGVELASAIAERAAEKYSATGISQAGVRHARRGVEQVLQDLKR